MNEFVVAQVNADVRRAVSVGAEENQIARDKVGGGNWRAEFVLDVSGARNGDAGIGEDVLNVARTVEAVRGGAAEDIRNADIVHRQRNNTVRQIARVVSDVGHIFAQESRISRRAYQAVSFNAVGLLKGFDSIDRRRAVSTVRHNVIAEQNELSLNFGNLLALVAHSEMTCRKARGNAYRQQTNHHHQRSQKINQNQPLPFLKKSNEIIIF